MIVDNPHIKAELIARWTELGWYSLNGKRAAYAFIIKDAKERAPHMKITSDRLSKYLNDYQHENSVGKKNKGSLTENQLLWLLLRSGIDVAFQIGKPVLEDGKLEFKVMPYNELSAIKKIKDLFPKPKK